MIDLDGFGDRIAIRERGGRVSYAELGDRVRAMAAQLAERGVEPGEPIALPCRPDRDTVVRALALLRRGCCAMPVAADLPEEERRRACDALGARWLGADGPEGAPNAAAAAKARGAAQALLSSGSTGAPKIALRSRDQVAAGVEIFSRGLGLAPDDRVLALVPLEHSVGFNSAMLAALATGASLVFPGSTHPRTVAAVAEEEGVTLFPAPALFFDMMLRFLGSAPRRLRSVRACLAVGELTSARVHDAFVRAFGAPLWQSYGASECGPALLNRVGARSGEDLALGEPYPGVEVAICDASGEAAGEGETGEIVVRSPAVGIGYADETDGASRIEGDRFFTGDLAFERDGALHFAGRKKLLIVTAGRKVDPIEVEGVLKRHPDVLDAAVFGDGEGVRAAVVAARPVAVGALIDFCARSLAPYKIPRAVEFRDAIPRSAAGKLLRDRVGG